jgi:hypothetical protein
VNGCLQGLPFKGGSPFRGPSERPNPRRWAAIGQPPPRGPRRSRRAAVVVLVRVRVHLAPARAAALAHGAHGEGHAVTVRALRAPLLLRWAHGGVSVLGGAAACVLRDAGCGRGGGAARRCARGGRASAWRLTRARGASVVGPTPPPGAPRRAQLCDSAVPLAVGPSSPPGRDRGPGWGSARAPVSLTWATATMVTLRPGVFGAGRPGVGVVSGTWRALPCRGEAVCKSRTQQRYLECPVKLYDDLLSGLWAGRAVQTVARHCGGLGRKGTRGFRREPRCVVGWRRGRS